MVQARQQRIRWKHHGRLKKVKFRPWSENWQDVGMATTGWAKLVILSISNFCGRYQMCTAFSLKQLPIWMQGKSLALQITAPTWCMARFSPVDVEKPRCSPVYVEKPDLFRRAHSSNRNYARMKQGLMKVLPKKHSVFVADDLIVDVQNLVVLEVLDKLVKPQFW